MIGQRRLRGWMFAAVACSVIALAAPVHAQRQMRAQRTAEARQIAIAAVREVMRQPRHEAAAANCITLPNRAAPDSAFLAAVRVSGQGPVVPPEQCPPTYDPGERVMPVPPGPRPAGAVDPYEIAVSEVRASSASRGRAKVIEIHGSSATTYDCTAVRSRRGWTAECQIVGMAIF